MNVDRQEVLRIARLARLALTDEEIERIGDDLGKILEYVAQIQAVPVEGVSTELDPERRHTTLREDEVRPGLSREQALENAPDTDGTAFRVPPVLPSAEH